MYVCLCKGITDEHIKQEMHNGANRLKDLVNNLGLAKDCGQCVVATREVFQSIQAKMHTDLFYAAIVSETTAA